MNAPRINHIDLILFRSKASLTAEVSRTYLSFLWWLVDPLMDLLLFYIVLGLILQRGGPGFVQNLLVGILIIRWFISGTNNAVNQLYLNSGLISSISIPKYVFPATQAVVSTIKFMLVFSVFLILLAAFGASPDATWFWLIPLGTVQFMLVLGSSFIVAGITPLLPDFAFLYSKVTMILFWCSGVFFVPENLIQGKALHYFYYNPMAAFISLYRGVILEGTFDSGRFVYVLLFSLVVVVLGYSFLSYFDKKFPRMLLQR